MHNSHVLDIDIGNTRVKWRSSCGQRGVFEHHQGAATFSMPDIDNVQSIWVASVFSEVAQKVSAQCDSQYGMAPHLLTASQSQAGVTNSYDHVLDMGVDRWLGIIAAYQVLGACFVVDCGSACTIDRVDACGHHKGGLIIPGLSLASNSLYEKIARPAPSFEWPSDLLLGQSTVDCVVAGVSTALVGAVLHLHTELPELPLMFTGGDGKALKQLLDTKTNANTYYEADLVLDGITIARTEGK